LDIPNNWKIFESTLNQINPQYAQLLNYVFSLAGKDKDEKYDLRAELLGSLGDDIISYERKPASTSVGDLKDPPGIYLIGSPDPEKLAAAENISCSALSGPAKPQISRISAIQRLAFENMFGVFLAKPASNASWLAESSLYNASETPARCAARIIEQLMAVNPLVIPA